MDQEKQSLLAEGSYGCTFRPPLLCGKKGTGAGVKGAVGKLARRSNAEHELEVSTALRKISGWKELYALQGEDDCTRKELNSLYNTYRSDCDLLRRIDKRELVHLVSPYGGLTIRQLPVTYTFDLLEFMRHTVKAVAEMHKLGYGHFDIHEGNIVVDVKGVARLIDFGKSMRGDAIDKYLLLKHTFAFTPQFIWQAPELTVMNGIQEGMAQGLAIHRTFEKKGVFHDIQNYLGISTGVQRHRFTEFWNFSESAQGRAWDVFFRRYWRKFDVWALGVVYIKLVKLLLVNTRYITDTWPKISDRVLTVLKGMLQAAPRDRLSIELIDGILND